MITNRTSHDYAEALAGTGPSTVGRTGQYWDNALAESFFATLKRELTSDRPWPGQAATHTLIFEWIEGWYNLRRMRSSLGHHSPADYETTLAA